VGDIILKSESHHSDSSVRRNHCYSYPPVCVTPATRDTRHDTTDTHHPPTTGSDDCHFRTFANTRAHAHAHAHACATSHFDHPCTAASLPATLVRLYTYRPAFKHHR
jgi:hypothetical protein